MMAFLSLSLIDEANSMGGYDNTTVIVCDII